MTRRVRASWRQALLGVAGFALLIGVIVHLDPERVLVLLESVGWRFTGIAAIFLAHECVRTMAVRVLIESSSAPSLPSMLRIRFLGELAGTVTRAGPFATEPSRAWLLAGHGGAGMAGYAAAFGELAINSCTSATLNVVVAIVAIATQDLQGPLRMLAHVLIWGSLTYIAVVATILLASDRLRRALAMAARAVPWLTRLRRIEASAARTMHRSVSLALTRSRREIARVLLLELTAQTLLASELYWTIRAIGVDVSFWGALFIEVMTRPVSVVQFVGVTEAGYAVVFAWLGLPPTTGLTLSLIKTLRSIVVSSSGLVALRVSGRHIGDEGTPVVVSA